MVSLTALRSPEEYLKQYLERRSQVHLIRPEEAGYPYR